MKKRGEMTRSYAKGMVALIFFVLAVQFAVFTIKSYENRGDVTTQYHEKDEPPVKPEIKADLAEKNNISRLYRGKGGVSKINHAQGNNSQENPAGDVVNAKEVSDIGSAEAYTPIDLSSVSSSARLELNSADSADLVSLPGIGPFFASKILDYRKRLGGFAFKEQLMEVYGIDRDRFSVFGEKIWADTALISRVKVSEATQEQLSSNPYIGAYAARAIIKYREMEGGKAVTLAALAANRIIKEELVKILKYYIE